MFRGEAGKRLKNLEDSMKKFLLKFCSIAAIIFIQSLGLAGVVFEIANTDQQTGEVSSTEILVEGTLLKMIFLDSGDQRVEVTRAIENDPEIIIADEPNSALDPSSVTTSTSASASDIDNANSGEMIYRADRKEMIVIDHQSKEYFVIDEAFLATIKENFGDVAEQMGEMNAMMQQAYEAALAQLDSQDLSPQERAATEQMLRNTFGVANLPAASGPVSLEIISTGEQSMVNNYPTVRYEVLSGSQKTQELWIASWGNLGAGAVAQEVFESYFNFFAEMSNTYNEMGFGFGGDSLNFFEAMEQIGGFPIFGKSFEGGVFNNEFALKSITERDFASDTFEPTAGYRLRAMEGFFE